MVAALRAGAQDDLIEIEWKVDELGRTLVRPHGLGNTKEFVPWFGDGLFGGPRWQSALCAEGRVDLTHAVASGGHVPALALLLPGSLDLASLCDAEHHYCKLGLGLDDALLLRRIATPAAEIAKGKPAPLVRRAHLDRILAVRIAGKRHLLEASDVLARVAKDETEDPLLRLAARDLLGPRLRRPFESAGSPEKALRDLPAAADVVVLLDQGTVPPWRRIWRIDKRVGLSEARMVLRAMGWSGGSAQHRAHAQNIADLPSR